MLSLTKMLQPMSELIQSPEQTDTMMPPFFSSSFFMKRCF